MFAKVVPADAASLADAGILFPADPAGVVAIRVAALAVAELAVAGILFQLTKMGCFPQPTLLTDLADAGILFPAILAGIPIPADPAGILFLADLAEPVTVGVADLPDAGILFPAVPAGIPFPADPARILFPADLAEPVTVGVADLADAGILFPAFPAGILFPADPAGILFPADLAEPVTVGVADLDVAGTTPLAVPDVFTELELVTIKVADEVETVDGIPVSTLLRLYAVGGAIQVTWSSLGGGGGSSGPLVLPPLVSRWAWPWCHPISASGHTVVCTVVARWLGVLHLTHPCCPRRCHSRYG